MQDQHKKITGYRDLTLHEIDLMNRIKAKGAELDDLVAQVRGHVADQKEIATDLRAAATEPSATQDAAELELLRLKAAEPERWASIGRTHFQEGLMALTRAVAQPTSF